MNGSEKPGAGALSLHPGPGHGLVETYCVGSPAACGLHSWRSTHAFQSGGSGPGLCSQQWGGGSSLEILRQLTGTDGKVQRGKQKGPPTRGLIPARVAASPRSGHAKNGTHLPSELRHAAGDSTKLSLGNQRQGWRQQMHQPEITHGCWQAGAHSPPSTHPHPAPTPRPTGLPGMRTTLTRGTLPQQCWLPPQPHPRRT